MWEDQYHTSDDKRDIFARVSEDDGAHWSSRALDNRLSAENGIIADDVAMFGGGGHVLALRNITLGDAFEQKRGEWVD